MTNYRVDRALTIGLQAVLVLMLGAALLAYLVSPLRDPSFPGQGAHGSATIAWLSPEIYWMRLCKTLSVALATVLTLLLGSRWRPYLSRYLPLKVLSLSGLWVVIAYVTFYISMWYLLMQYIID